MNRKLVISALVIILLAAGAAAWFLIPRTPKPPGSGSFFGELPFIGGQQTPGATTPTTPPPTAPGTQTGQLRPLRQIIDREVIGAAMGADGQSLLYLSPENGHIFSANLDGKSEQKLTNLTVLEIFDALWPTKKNRVAISYHENGEVKRFLEGVASGTPSRFLPREATALDWSPDGLQLAYLTRRQNDNALIVADSANQNPRVIFTTPIPDFAIKWVAKQTLLLVSRPSGAAENIVLRVNPSNGASSYLIGGLGIAVSGAPDGSGFLISQTSGGVIEDISYFSIKNGAAVAFGAKTIAEKCAFSPDSKKIYCGVPTNTFRGPMPDQWYKGAVSFTDKIVVVDTTNGDIETLMEGVASVDVISPFTSPDGKYFFFQDKKTGTLWRLEL